MNLGDPCLSLVDVDVDDGALDEQLEALPNLGPLLLALGHAQLKVIYNLQHEVTHLVGKNLQLTWFLAAGGLLL